MIKRINNIIKNLIKPEYDLILENLISEQQKRIFHLFYIDKMSRNDIQKELNISRYNLETNLEIIRKKISKIPQFDCKFRVDETNEARLIERCKKLGKSQEYIKFCVLAFCKKFTKKQIADIMCLDIETVRKYKSIRRKELEK